MRLKFSSFPRALVAAIVVAILATFGTLRAHAAGPAFTRLFAAAEDAVTSLTNPAGMTRLEKSQLLTQSIVANSFADFKVDENLTTMDGGSPRGSDPALIPSIYYVRPMGEDWRLGLSFTIPAGFGATTGSNWAGRYYSDEFSLVFAALNVMVAYPVNDWLSLGGGISGIYSGSESKTQVPNPGLDEPDAKLKTDVSGATIGWTASALIEFTENTRLGISWGSEAESDDDLQIKLKDSTLPQPIIDDINALGKNDELTLRTPQRLSIGAFHEWDNGWSATIDAMWIEFSRFGLTEIGIRDQEFHVPDGNFKDFWIFTAGFAYPISDRMEGRVGALYVQQPVSDEDRTFSFALDEAYGLGFGVQYLRNNGHLMDLNLSVMNTGEAPVDTGPSSSLTDRGRVAGKNDTPYAVVLEFDYHWW